MAAQSNTIHKSSVVVKSSSPARNHSINNAAVVENIDEHMMRQDQYISSSHAITFSTLNGPRRPTPTVRDTRTSAERHPFAFLMEEDDLLAELQLLNGAGR